MKAVQSLAPTENKDELKAYGATEEILFLDALPVSTIRDGVKHGQMHFIHRVLRRAPRRLGSALATVYTHVQY